MAVHDRRTKAAARAARNRRYLCRKKNRVTCANVEVSELVIDFFERARWLRGADVHDASKIGEAIKGLLELSAKI
jgi:hypothetical protein